MPRLKRLNFDYLASTAWNRYVEDRPKAIAIDTETTGFEFFDTPFCVTVAWDGFSGYFELVEVDKRTFIRKMLQNTPEWIFHNAKFDLQKLILDGLVQRPSVNSHTIHDTEALAHLLDENRLKGLKYLAKTVLGKTTDEDEYLKKVRRALKLKKDDGYHLIPRAAIYPYACKDAAFTFALWKRLLPKLLERQNLAKLYREEMALTLVLLDMEAKGMGVDLDYVNKTVKEYGDRIFKTERLIERLVEKPIGKKVKDGEFNPASPEQVKEAFRERGISIASTDKHHLSTLDDPLAASLLDYRHLAKMRATYLLPLIKEQRSGIIHPNFRQHGAKARLSSGAYVE